MKYFLLTVTLFLIIGLSQNSFAQEAPDYFNPYAPIFTDKEVYSWTDKVYITVVAPSWNANKNGIDSIGTQDGHFIKISTSGHSLKPYKLSETEPNSGVFVGEIILTGFLHDTDGDGDTDTNPRTAGNGPTNGFLETKRDGGLTISFEFADGVVLTHSATISWNVGELIFTESNYLISETARIRVTDPDMNLNPEVIDQVIVELSSDSDLAGIFIDAIETEQDSGLFEAVVSFSQNSASGGNRLFAKTGDSIYAKYNDNTLPSPYSISDNLDIQTTSKLELETTQFSSPPIIEGELFEEYGVRVETIAENLEVPWSIVFSPDGRIFVTERVGNLRVIENGQLLEQPVKILDVGFVEGGLLGIELDPNFEENHYIYLYYTYSDFVFTYNKVVRFKELNNELSDEKILIDKIPGGPIHDGGRLKFGPDGKLYVTTGEAGNPGLAQDLNSLGGKILRLNSDGTIPEDNPFPNSPVFSYGHRNPQGLDWDPLTEKLVISEHGPSGERGFAHDEVNVIEAGKNYGWPEIVGDETGSNYVSPLLHTGTDTWAPSGAVFYDSNNISEWENKFFIATLRGNHLRMLDLDLEQDKVVSNEALFLGDFGRLRDASLGPDGNLYLLTSNRDGRGTPFPNDDRILRVVPVESSTKQEIFSELLPPLKQFKLGISVEDITCKEGLELIKKYDNTPACVKPSSVTKLIERGWALN